MVGHAGLQSPPMDAVHKKGDPDPRSILVVLPTWVGDFVMATPTLRAIRDRFPDAHIALLIEPNLRDLAAGGDWMNECIEWPPPSRGLLPARTLFNRPHRDLIWDLRRRRFDWAVLLPNSFRSALLARLAGAQRRIGYDRDGRGFLLTDRLPVSNRLSKAERAKRRSGVPDAQVHGQTSLPMPPDLSSRGPTSLPVPTGIRTSARAKARGSEMPGIPTPKSLSPYHPHRPVHLGRTLPVRPGRYVPIPLVEYFADLAEAIGCERPGDRIELFATPNCDDAVRDRLTSLGVADHHPLVVISPGARYGAAKCWSPERFAGVADRLIESENAAVLVTCGPGEELIARHIGSAVRSGRRGRMFVLDSPRLTLGELKSLIRRCDLLLCNDAGPRHFAKAFDVPVVTVFGPTHPQWTATSYRRERIVPIYVDCGPCQQRTCPLGQVQCMNGVTVAAVVEAAIELLAKHAPAATLEPVDA